MAWCGESQSLCLNTRGSGGGGMLKRGGGPSGSKGSLSKTDIWLRSHLSSLSELESDISSEVEPILENVDILKVKNKLCQICVSYYVSTRELPGVALVNILNG